MNPVVVGRGVSPISFGAVQKWAGEPNPGADVAWPATMSARGKSTASGLRMRVGVREGADLPSNLRVGRPLAPLHRTQKAKPPYRVSTNHLL